MTPITVPCPTCSSTGTDTHEDRHTETRMDICRTCGGERFIPARTGETPEASFRPDPEADLSAQKIDPAGLTRDLWLARDLITEQHSTWSPEEGHTHHGKGKTAIAALDRAIGLLSTASLAASPVGDEARWGVEDTGESLWVGPMRRDGVKVDHIVYGQDLRGYRAEYAARVRAEAHLIVDSVNAALASHPTTRQETVATPRDGGVREALIEALRPFGESCQNHFHDASVLDTFEPDHSVLHLIRDGKLSPTGVSVGDLIRARDLIADTPAPSKDTHRRFMAPLAAWARDLNGKPVTTADLADLVGVCATLATPSPAQEPGTEDTGGWRTLKFDDPRDEGLADALQVSTRQLTVQWRGSPQDPTIGWLRDDRGKPCVASSDRMHAAILAIRATPATTAETRGPADQTKGGL